MSAACSPSQLESPDRDKQILRGFLHIARRIWMDLGHTGLSSSHTVDLPIAQQNNISFLFCIEAPVYNSLPNGIFYSLFQHICIYLKVSGGEYEFWILLKEFSW